MRALLLAACGAVIFASAAGQAQAQARRPPGAPWSQSAGAPGFPQASAAGDAVGVAQHVTIVAGALIPVPAARAREARDAAVARVTSSLESCSAFSGRPVALADRRGRHRPVRGTLVHQANTRRSSATRTHVRSAGWTWQVSNGAEVSAISDGHVSWTGVIAGYGGVVIVWHAPGEHSVYLGLAEIEVEVGWPVARASPLGAAGQMGAHGGMEVSVEIRQDGVPVDPSPWLRP